MNDIDILPNHLTVWIQKDEFEETTGFETPGNGPFGTPFKGFKLWTEFYPA